MIFKKMRPLEEPFRVSSRGRCFGGVSQIQQIKDCLLRLYADGLGGDLSVFEDHQGGDAHNAVFLSKSWFRIDVYLADQSVVANCLGDLVKNRRHHAARIAPGSPEIH